MSTSTKFFRPFTGTIRRVISVSAITILALAGAVTATLSTTTIANAQVQRVAIKNPDGKPIDVIKELRTADVIPGGGKIGYQYTQSFAEARREGYNTLRLGRGLSFQNAVYSIQIRAATLDTDGSGCGIITNANDNSSVLLLLSNDRFVYLAQFLGDTDVQFEFNKSIDKIKNVDATEYELDAQSIHTITLVINEQEAWLFLNGVELVREDDADAQAGQFGITLYNAEGNTTTNQCRYSNIWIWNLDA